MSGVRSLRRCLVLGGAGAVGGLFARALREAGAEVVVADPATGCGDATAPDAALRAEISTADLVLLAVPERVALAALPVLAEHVRPGALVADTLSVKSAVAPVLTGLREVEAVSLNPMFAPSLGFAGESVAAVVVHDGPKVTELLALVGEWGAHVVRLSAADHDRLAAATQVLTHAAVLGFGLALAGLTDGVGEVAPLATPPHRTLLALLARIAAGTPEVYWDVQAANPRGPATRSALADGLRHVADLVDRGDEAGFGAALARLRDYFGPELSPHAEHCAQLFGSTPHRGSTAKRGSMTQQTATQTANWVESRISRTSDSLDRAFEQGLTGHTITARRGKRVWLAEGGEALEFVSCSYLGLEEHPALIEAAEDALRRFGVHFSSSRNRMRPHYLPELEDLLGTVYRGNRAVAFTSVGTVHLGVLPLLGSGALPSYPIAPAGAAFLVEKTAHSSMQILRGLLGQIGPARRFDLEEPGSMETALREVAATGRTPIALVDGVGSMGGLIDVAGVLEALRPHGGHLYVDDAHGISIAGPLGAGYAFDTFGDRLPDNVVIAGSLSKAFGGSGGFALVPGEADVRVLRKFANPLVFGHSIMLPLLAANVAAARLHVDGEVARLQERLWRNAADFDELTGGRLVNAGLRSPVRGAHFATEAEAFATTAALKDAGVLILPAFFPTVAKGTGLVRFALSALHERADLETAAKILEGTRYA
ncbi:aminotransferase class I/II-fold pyridoxal phosphate-dependent enzyme [Lentzea jiangxiensis]|uniref:7-keto-8-aminopelargonate synthetase n=1 Tax=Lentzea jiangxiensis TaxID=641025 RepID=A0A1H0VNJ5_9PSEU|nr:aminotransferase class I/II-fold pyridoxal phosphate-dependent enzyme [Lentzea jiangxiensis]SDP80010.1 7-keto-8-aminopelargonate synthetase [Lentzea jiangxiensis]